MSLIFSLVFLFSIAIAPAAFALDGNGTKDDPYLIANQSDLEAFRDFVNEGGDNAGAHAKLTQDITLEFDEGKSWTPIANYSYDNQIRYTGTFDGGGHAISGLLVNVSSSDAGFFGYVGEGGIVKNLTIASDGRVSGYMYFGSIAGVNAGIVENCANSATVSGNQYVGGIVGYNSGYVLNCTNSATVSGSSYLGGIVGYNSGYVLNCTNSESVSGTRQNVGGIVGYNSRSGTVENCANSATVSGNPIVQVGGIAGASSYDTVKNCGYLYSDNYNGIGNNNDDDCTNVSSFSSDEEAQIAVTLSASIADSAIAANGQTTITLTTQPGTASDVMKAGGLEISPSDSSGIVDITPNEDGTLTVRANGNGTGETVIRVEVALYTYNYSSGEYDKDPDTATTYEFTFDLTVNDVADEEETGTPGEEDTGGDNGEEETGDEESGDDSGSTESGSTSGGSGGGGCNAGIGALALLALIPLALRRKR